MAEKLLSLTILSWNRKDYLKQTVERIIQTSTIPTQLIMVDNNSAPESGVRDYLSDIKKDLDQKFKEVVYVFNDRNLGVAGGRSEGLVRSTGDYLVTLDDDILLPPKWDVCIKDACDKVPKLGITGVNVEPNKYPIKVLNGVRMQVKDVGNLGGACLALPRRIFNVVGYYGFGRGSLYGHEDAIMKYKMDYLKLLSAYIEFRGVHIDTDQAKNYRKAKNDAHTKGSIQLSELSVAIKNLHKTGNVYTPYTPPDKYHPVDESIFTNELVKKG